jgi:hypothetical protein
MALLPFEFLPADGAAKLWKLSGLQKPTSWLREIHRGSSKKTKIFSPDYSVRREKAVVHSE